MLFVTWLDDPFRPTRDLDLLGYGANNGETMTDAFRAICSTAVPDDGVTFDLWMRFCRLMNDAQSSGTERELREHLRPVNHTAQC